MGEILDKIKKFFYKMRHWERKINFTIGCFAAVFECPAIFDRYRKILLVHHNYGTMRWSFPGGGPKYQGEPFPKMAVRGTKEEAGFDIFIDPDGLDAVINFKNPAGAVFLFRGYIVGGDGRPFNRGEISETGFFNEEEVDALWRKGEIYPAQYRLVKIAFKNLGYTAYEWPEDLRNI